MATVGNSFDGGTDAATITTGNSGGTSGDALAFVVGTPTYSNTHAHSGTLSAKMLADSFNGFGYNTSAAQLWVRLYLWLPANSFGPIVKITSTASAGGTVRGSVDVTIGGGLTLICAAGSSTLAGPITLNSWVRIEARWSTTSGADLQLYNSADSGTPTASVTVATNMAGTAASQEVLQSLDTDAWFDDFAVSTDGSIGPAVSAYPRSPVISTAAAQRRSRW